MNATREAVLDALGPEPVSGPDLAAELDISRAAVWNHIEALRDAGFGIDSEDGGYTLASVPEFGGQAVEYGLEAPFAVEYHDSIDSTNRRARERADAGDRDVVILADEQTGGRGRLGRAWQSPSGGIWLSAVLDPAVPTAQVPACTLAAAVAVTRAAREAGVEATIKWPNDVVVGEDERKLAGILTESRGEADRVAWVVVGMGINANIDTANLGDTAAATSLAGEVGAIDRRVFTQGLLEALDELRGDLRGAVDEWATYAATLGKEVRVTLPERTIEGTAVDVSFPGALVVETETERITVTAGDCEHLRPV
jgi:BirA family biotin operon repressor/biotin-[acetyl-CoA-carboxylase] ligase